MEKQSLTFIFTRYFLEQGYAVIFLHRQGSLQPFSRNFPSHEVLDLLQLKDLPDGSNQLEGMKKGHKRGT